MTRPAAIDTAKRRAFESGVPFYAVQRSVNVWIVIRQHPNVAAGTKIYKAFPSSVDSGMVQDA